MSQTLYFAYGSNLSAAQLRERCPHSRYLTRAQLAGYQFVINARGVASIAEDPSSVVHGMLCALSDQDEMRLDKFEGVARGCYLRKKLPVSTDSADGVLALVYVDPTVATGNARSGYLEKILAGARAHGLPAEYVEEVGRWASIP